jgi:hypothetical protein
MTLAVARRSVMFAGLAVLAVGPVNCANAQSAVPAVPQSQDGARPTEAPPEAASDAELLAALGKSRAYVDLMNRTMRAVQSWNRYRSWVDMRRGPTGRERYIAYGLYSLYDVRGEIEKASQAVAQAPSFPELDDVVRRYIQSYQALAPLIDRAERYYERKDYRDDAMAEGRDLHRQMVPLAEAFLADRAELEEEMRKLRGRLNGQELAAIERREGRSARWQIRNIMMSAREIIDVMPTNERPVADMRAFDAAIARYSAAVREMDAFKRANPDSMSIIDSQASSWLGQVRELREKLARSRGDVRRSATEANWVFNQFNMMVSVADSAMRTRR